MSSLPCSKWKGSLFSNWAQFAPMSKGTCPISCDTLLSHDSFEYFKTCQCGYLFNSLVHFWYFILVSTIVPFLPHQSGTGPQPDAVFDSYSTGSRVSTRSTGSCDCGTCFSTSDRCSSSPAGYSSLVGVTDSIRSAHSDGGPRATCICVFLFCGSEV